MKTIEIIVSPNGLSQVETRGFAGAECQSASEFVERGLGKRLEERLTPEFHELCRESDPLLEPI